MSEDTIISGKGFNNLCDFTFCTRYDNHFGEQIHIGNSETQTKKIVLDKIYPSNTEIMFVHNHKDTFSYELNGKELTVTRTDENYGWGQNLIGYIYKNIEINENNKIFLNPYLLKYFLNILEKNPPKNKFTLILHNSDNKFTEETYKLIEKYVNKVYTINNIFNHENVYTIPIGFMDWPNDTYSVVKNIKEEQEKTILIYLNFSILTNPEKRARCFYIFHEKPWVTVHEFLPIEEFYLQMAKSKYILSPEGAGIDCHRIYEAICLDSIPILEKTEMDDFYKNLPVLIVDDYNSVTENDLKENYEIRLNKLKEWKKNNPEWFNPKFWIK